jgi:3-isopropylmalate/(R)-2-methylmalate dehydratase small subunit
MQKIARIQGIAAPLMAENISTDIISPSELYLKPRKAYGPGLFGPWRYRDDGSENHDFVLVRERFRNASILVTGRNFGCGSSRQIAVWCLQDYGVRCVIAPSFGDIFSENAFKSGLLVVELPAAEVGAIAAELEAEDNPAELCVDLSENTVTTAAGRVIGFEIDAFRRAAYLEGLDEIDMILRQEAAIAGFQKRLFHDRPWVVPDESSDTNSVSSGA